MEVHEEEAWSQTQSQGSKMQKATEAARSIDIGTVARAIVFLVFVLLFALTTNEGM